MNGSLASSASSFVGGYGGKSDTLEARTKLTSYSALDLGGLPRLSAPILTSREPVTLAGLNSRLEAVSGA